MKNSLKIASVTCLCAVLALTLTFCSSKPAETQAETTDTLKTEVDTLATPADSLTNQAPADSATLK